MMALRTAYQRLEDALALVGARPVERRRPDVARLRAAVGAGLAPAEPAAWLCAGPMDENTCASCQQYPCPAMQALFSSRQGMLAWLVLSLSA